LGVSPERTSCYHPPRVPIPNAHLAVVDRAKVVEYLLNPAHPDNGGKAAFFTGQGFAIDRWQVLAAALQQLAVDTQSAPMVATIHGTKYIVDGPLTTPAGARPIVRSVWIIDTDAENPRLVTAYPQA
jgi:hypothetical protein